MKQYFKILSLLAITLPCLVFNNNLSLLDIKATENEDVNVYLALTANGLYNGQKGQNSEELFLENYISYSGAVNSLLPDETVITSTVEDVVFTSWIKYDSKGVPTVIDKLTSNLDGEILYAFFSYEGDYNGGGGQVTPPDPEDLVRIYFEDATWWAADGAATSIYMWNDSGSTNSEWPGVVMNNISGTNIWYYDVDVSSYTHVIFARTSTSGTDWGAKTIDIALSSRGENNMYTISGSDVLWGDPGVSGSWTTYSA